MLLKPRPCPEPHTWPPAGRREIPFVTNPDCSDGQHPANQEHLEPPEGIADAAVRYGTEYKEITAS